MFKKFTKSIKQHHRCVNEAYTNFFRNEAEKLLKAPPAKQYIHPPGTQMDVVTGSYCLGAILLILYPAIWIGSYVALNAAELMHDRHKRKGR